jgi:hypothetical protein
MKKINFSFLLVGFFLASCNSSEKTEQKTQNSEENPGYTYSINIEKTEVKELDEIIQNYFESLKNDFAQNQKSGEITVQTLSNYRDKNISSVLFEIESFGSDMPHPNTTFKSYNFHLTDRKSMVFSDFFTLNSAADSSNFVQLLFDNSDVTADIVLVDNNDLINNSVLSFTKDKVVFSYGHNTFASWSDGIFHITISREKLKKYTKK